MAAPECSREVRKRRERRDSGSHERKERRPHSEERPPSALPSPPLHDHNRLESERRAERLSRARRPQFGGKRRRQPFRVTKQYDHKQSKENDRLLEEDENLDTYHTNEVECGADKVQVVQTVCGVSVDWCVVEEPTVSLSAIRPPPAHIDTSRPPPTTTSDAHMEKRLYKISKKISVLKKNIAKYETENGAPITPSERITDVHLTSMYETLRKLQVEKRCIKSDPIEYARALQAAKIQRERDEKLECSLKSDKPMTEVVEDIEEWLAGCRESAGRSGSLESWSAGQLAHEKCAVQRALLRLEAARGRPPAHSKDRGAARGLYDRYRTVKRALQAVRPDMIGGNNGELATIHEHETMLFNSSVDSSSDSQEKQSSGQDSEVSVNQPTTPSPPEDRGQCEPGSPAEDQQSNEGLHCLSLDQLARALADAKIQKCVLKRSLKDYEVSFELQNSRKIQKDDIIGKEDEYSKYKTVKARIKLLNALINKQKSTKSNLSN